MIESRIWSVDILAATDLLTRLGLEANDDRMALVADHLARHRLSACEWAAERMIGNVTQRLEDEAREQLQHRSDAWADGFRSAEQAVVTMSHGEMLGIRAPRGRTKGQMLRTLVRQARSRSATV